MIKGQVVSGDFSKIAMRVKQDQNVELGELLVIQDGTERFILQVYDLVYASQISQQNLELVSGMNLEEDSNFQLMDKNLRNYQIALLKPMLNVSERDLKQVSNTCKKLPNFFSTVRAVQKEDLQFITRPNNPFYLGKLRSGSQQLDLEIFLPGKEVFSHHLLIPASTGKGKSNLMSTILWDCHPQDFVGMLVLDPHDEYCGRVGLGLKDHPQKDNLMYYTPSNPPPGAKTLKINLKSLKPEHFQGAIALTDPQRQCLHAYYRIFQQHWIKAILEERKIEGVSFHPDTVAVVKRKLISLLQIELSNGQLICQGIFDEVAGENTVREICKELEQAKTVILDTSYFSGALEIMIGSIIANEALKLYKYYKRQGLLEQKPVLSIVLEEAPRVLGKKVLEQGTNIFDTIAREGRKFKVGLVAITQLPSEIPKNILANMNTKIILGIEMGSERQAVIESSAQDLSQDSRNIASLDKGEALVSSTFTRFAVPIKIPYFPEYVKEQEEKKVTEQAKVGQGNAGSGPESSGEVQNSFPGVGM